MLGELIAMATGTRRICVDLRADLADRLERKAVAEGTTIDGVFTQAATSYVGDFGVPQGAVQYVVQPGDTLSGIAFRFYGDYSKWRIIADYNHIENPNLISVGQVLLIPDTSQGPITPTEPLPAGESPFIYGFHDLGGENIMLQAGVPGWVLHTTKVNEGTRDFSPQVDHGLGVMVRLNNGYSSDDPGSRGTIPFQASYGSFASKCADWVGRSRGCRIWIVGNEPNMAAERPGYNTPVEQIITPDRYADCYRQVRNAIRGLNGHDKDQIIVAAAAPWNDQTRYSGNPSGFWIQYFTDILNILGNACDGIAIHTYTHGIRQTSAGVDTLIQDETQPWPQFPGAHFNFRTYRDFMAAIPAGLRNRPVYVTETDQDRDPNNPQKTWDTRNVGWVRQAYDEINTWNSNSQNQKIRALLLYRWINADPWGLGDNSKPGVLDDFRQSLTSRYRWHNQ
ncbi:MAG: LysM peptidoglycan-binding domain-containing protein [Chloroflexi bacterium]|nr:LysM peptidoglycan-binding domain-containing protein [Chloroflexota bacterium]